MKHLIIILVSLAAIITVNAQSVKKDLATSKADERSAVDLTIYNANLALVREERTLNLQKGVSSLVISDIPATIDGTSLHFLSLTAPDAVRVLEQNYQYDLVSQAKLLNKYLGQTVEWIRVDPATNKEYTVQGKLLSSGYVPNQTYAVGGMIAEINGKIEMNPGGRLILPQLPDGLILKPQLEWLIENSKGGRHQAEISYLASQMTWSANYVALLDKDDKNLSLTGWVTISNNCGTSFSNAGLKLVAGDVNIVQGEPNVNYAAKLQAGIARDEERQFKESGLFEYHLYSLQRRTDVMNDETKQIELIAANNVNAQKIFVYDGIADQWKYWSHNYGYREQGSLGQQSNPKVGVYVTFKNSEKNDLGIPLPKGKVRVYKRDDDGKEQFVGEDQIDHTPKDEQLRLYMGNAFDLVGERVQKDFKVIVSGHLYDESFEIKVRNHKKEDVTVYVYEHPWRWSEWDITKSSAEWKKVDQSTIQFPVTIPANGERVISYTVRYKW
jgi:hypothetical protein